MNEGPKHSYSFKGAAIIETENCAHLNSDFFRDD